MTGAELFEINIGVYAAGKNLVRLAADFSLLLEERDLPSQLSVARSEGDFYADLAGQWRTENPGADPGTRELHEIRVGVYTSREDMDALRAELIRLLCPDAEHDTPCPVPWASGYIDAGVGEDGVPDPDQSGYLGDEYGHLVPS
ncbi:hypothetical protein [Phytomonospora endophytica]|uniref:Uncharacterized protein n=1 Tax=Phytomonospora endophytica TaxID=714109 RepID=A0A841FEQ8_9ACTN|nr:hypothetical protein [Phytomonospora endophytica]MBB6034756.1 hypothetical protein [Phytomonospora endophytica]GIG69041.1 hypothetical protein Pen01_53360 [Phytomonospora endophytica]